MITRVNVSCRHCYGVFDAPKSFFNGKDEPKFCPYCGKEKLEIKSEHKVAHHAE